MSRFVPEGVEVPLSFGVAANGWVVVSGQVGHQDFALVPGGFEPEFRQAIVNLRNVLQSHGADFKDVVKVNVYLDDIADFGPMNDIWTEAFKAPFPARTAIAAVLPFGAKVEMEAWAYIGER
jgi:2-iminobutanoate/2-iminopropanoate deaminase